MLAGVLAFCLLPLALAKGPQVTHNVVFTMEQDGKVIGDIKIGLYGKTVPKTAEKYASVF